MNHISCDGCKPHVATVWQSIDSLNVTAGSTYIYHWFCYRSVLYREFCFYLNSHRVSWQVL